MNHKKQEKTNKNWLQMRKSATSIRYVMMTLQTNSHWEFSVVLYSMTIMNTFSYLKSTFN